MRRAFIIALCLLPTTASAQGDVIARCGWEAGQWVCRQPAERPNIVDNANRARQAGWDEMERVRRALPQHAPSPSRSDIERERVETLELVERYIALGRCREAIDLAFRELGSTEGDRARERCPN